MTLRPAKDLARYLNDNVPDLSLGKNLFYGPIRAKQGEVPSKAVFLFPSGGTQPQHCVGSEDLLRTTPVVARIRGDCQKYDEGLDLALAVRDAAYFAPLSDYVDVNVVDAAPVYLGEDDAGHPEWSLTINMIAEE